MPASAAEVRRLLHLSEPMSGSFANAAAALAIGGAGVYLLTIGKKDDSAFKMALGAGLIVGAMFVF